MAAKSTRHVQITLHGDQLQGYVVSSLNVLRWKWWQPRPLVFRASVKTSWSSWGEAILIDISHPGWMTVESKCAFPLQLIDWGKNKKNVSKFLDQLNTATGMNFQ